MTWLDYAVIAVVVGSIAWGAWRGLVHEVLSLAGWVLAFLAANLLAAPAAEHFPSSMRPEFRVVGAFVAVFIVTLVVTTLASALITKFIKVSVLQGLDRWLGALFGLLRGVVIIVAFALVAGLTPLPRDSLWKQSVGAGMLTRAVVQLKPWLPPRLERRLRYD